jgi:hypothetical protein
LGFAHQDLVPGLLKPLHQARGHHVRWHNLQRQAPPANRPRTTGATTCSASRISSASCASTARWRGTTHTATPVGSSAKEGPRRFGASWSRPGPPGACPRTRASRKASRGGCDKIIEAKGCIVPNENFRTGRRARKIHGEGGRKTKLRKRGSKSTHLPRRGPRGPPGARGGRGGGDGGGALDRF